MTIKKNTNRSRLKVMIGKYINNKLVFSTTILISLKDSWSITFLFYQHHSI